MSASRLRRIRQSASPTATATDSAATQSRRCIPSGDYETILKTGGLLTLFPKVLTKFLFAVLFLGSAVLAEEGFFYLLNLKLASQNRGAFLAYEPTNAFTTNGSGLISLQPDAHGSVYLQKNGDRLFAHKYTTDHFGMRNSIPEGKNGNVAAVFLGGSDVFGAGVEDGETLPSAFCQIDKNWRCLNLGVPGIAAHIILRQLELGTFPALALGPSPTFLYIIIPEHVRRAVGSLMHLRYQPGSPYYDLRNDKVQFLGTFVSEGASLRLRFYRLLTYLPSIRYLQEFKGQFDLPIRMRPEQLKTFAMITAQMKLELARRWPGGKFLAVVLERYGEHNGKEIASALQKENITTLDLSDLSYENLGYDQHPSANGYRQIAKQIQGYLEK